MRSFQIIAVFIIGTLLIIPGCSKSDQVQSDQVQSTDSSSRLRLWKAYKDSIPGNWTWHHTYCLVINGDSTITNYADTTMSINLVNDSTLSIGSIILSYSDSLHYAIGGYGSLVDTANFVHYWKEGQYIYTAGIPKDLLLNRLNDSLFYTINHTGTALGSQKYEYFRTKITH